MKTKANTFWLISALSLAVAALWSTVAELSDVMGTNTVNGVVLIAFGVISVIAAFTYGLKSNGSGWILSDGIFSLCLGLSYLFAYIDYSLFTVDLVFIMGLWLMFLGLSQVCRVNKKSRSFGRTVAMAAGVLEVMGGLALFVRPVAELLQLTAGGVLQVYSTTYQFVIAALAVISRLLLKDARK